MKIKKLPKRIEDILIQYAACKVTQENVDACCIKNDDSKLLLLLCRWDKDGKSIRTEMKVLFCPFCGFSYE